MQYDEPRAATVKAIDMSEAISLSKDIYDKVLKHVAADYSNNVNDKSSKSYSIKVLQKKRGNRTDEELFNVSSYLDRRCFLSHNYSFF